MSIAQIVLSDLHLGARDSLLTHFHGGGEIADGPGEVLLSFAHGLRETLSDGEKPQLVLLGDALDLGLSERTVELHRARVMQKMEVRGLAQLVQLWLLLSPAQPPS